MQDALLQEIQVKKAKFHLPGLFEYYELYRLFLPLFYEHREYFHEDVEIASLYGAPADCLWGGGRVGFGEDDVEAVLALSAKYDISARLTFSNLFLTEEMLSDRYCNRLCTKLNDSTSKEMAQNGVIVASDLLTDYLREHYPNLYLVSSTTKVLTDYEDFLTELRREEMAYIVPDFRLNKVFEKLVVLSQAEKDKVEFLCNECCYPGCTDRKACYENVSRKILGEECPDHVCRAPEGNLGYRFSKVMENPCFIGMEEIRNTYLPMGFTNFKLEGRGLGSALILEMLIFYLVKPEFAIKVREEIYLDSNLDLF